MCLATGQDVAIMDERIVLVIGTSSGFGRLTAEALARRGHTVFAGMRDPQGKHAAAAAELTPPEVVEEVERWYAHAEKPAALLAQIGVPPAVRRGTGAWIVYEGLSVAFADGELARGEMDAVRGVATTMDVDDATVDALEKIVRDEAAVRERRIQTLHGTMTEKFRFLR